MAQPGEPVHPSSDDDLLVSTEPEAFATFYRRHAHAVQRYFLRRTGDRELAADLTNETFAAALIARRRYQPGGAPATAWLFTIAARRLIDHRRRTAGQERMRETLLSDARTQAEADERLAHLFCDGVGLSTLSQLPPEQRDAVSAHVLAGLSYPEISDSAGVSQAGVRQRVSRGLSTLRRVVLAYRAVERTAFECRPYAFGAGHGVPLASLDARQPLDCSSFASLVLSRAGLFTPERAWTSTQLAEWGAPGEGRCLTVWANDEHVWLEFRLNDRHVQRFDTGPEPNGRAAAAGLPAGDAVPRHIPGI
jgi:RNA polymerase sigma factor (sigma-70 family)